MSVMLFLLVVLLMVGCKTPSDVSLDQTGNGASVSQAETRTIEVAPSCFINEDGTIPTQPLAYLYRQVNCADGAGWLGMNAPTLPGGTVSCPYAMYRLPNLQEYGPLAEGSLTGWRLVKISGFVSHPPPTLKVWIMVADYEANEWTRMPITDENGITLMGPFQIVPYLGDIPSDVPEGQKAEYWEIGCGVDTYVSPPNPNNPDDILGGHTYYVIGANEQCALGAMTATFERAT